MYQLKVEKGDSIIQLGFEKTTDRFTHTIQVTNSNGSIELISKEGQGDEAWPSSPVIQELHFEPRDQSDVLLGVGMAGDSHFSVSVESNRSDELRFEFACRAKKSLEFTGSTYMVRNETELSILDNGVFELVTIGFCELSLDYQQSIPSKLLVVNHNQPDSLPATQQWGFSLKLL